MAQTIRLPIVLGDEGYPSESLAVAGALGIALKIDMPSLSLGYVALAAPVPGGIGSGAGTMTAKFQFSLRSRSAHPAGSDALTATSSGFRFVSQLEAAKVRPSKRGMEAWGAGRMSPCALWKWMAASAD